MEFRHKVAVLVALQITLIITSFLIIVYFESRTNLTGNIVNIAGKNRLLASLVQIELNHALFDDPKHGERILDALARLEENIHHLRHGGSINGMEIAPVPLRFDGDLSSIEDRFRQYHDMVTMLVSEKSFTRQNIEDAEQVGTQLVALSDTLTEKLGHDVEKLSAQLILLQVTLGTINVATHVFMIYFVWRIFNQYAAEQIKSEKFAAVGRFAAMIAHDMRNPLGTIRNSVTLILSDSKSELIRNETDRINRSIKRMSHQIDGVLNYVRATPFVLEPASIQEILRHSVNSMAIPENIALSLPGNDITVSCDAEKLEFVFTNLILNAIQAIGSDSGYITVKLDTKQDMIALSFENSGPSIPKKDMPKLFEPLFTTKMQGTGLGLTGCKNIIQGHRGTIAVDTNPVTFTISLPKIR